MASDDQILSNSMRDANFRVTGVDPKGGDIDEQFALIETEFAYGAPASDPTHRKIRVGDSLPEGEVTEITGDGIRVIPDEGPEYVIPLGGRQGYTPPVMEKKPTINYLPPTDMISSLDFVIPFGRRRIEEIRQTEQDFMDYIEKGESGMLEAINERARALREAAQDQGKFYDTDDPSEIYDSVQSDFSDAQENQRVLESLDTGDGRNMLFQDDDGNLSSYYVDNEGDAIRTTPEEDTIRYYEDPEPPKSDPLQDEFTRMLYEADQKRKEEKERAAMDEFTRMFESQDWNE